MCGSRYHVERALNEHICAAALFNYYLENIADNCLEFREPIDEKLLLIISARFEWEAAEILF